MRFFCQNDLLKLIKVCKFYNCLVWVRKILYSLQHIVKFGAELHLIQWKDEKNLYVEKSISLMLIEYGKIFQEVSQASSI